MTNHRSKDRIDVTQMIVVHDCGAAGRELGTIVNLHEDGFMMILSGGIKERGTYQFEFELSDPVAGVSSLLVGAICLWVSNEGAGSMAWAGFEIIDISDSDKKIISQLIGQINE